MSKTLTPPGDRLGAVEPAGVQTPSKKDPPDVPHLTGAILLTGLVYEGRPATRILIEWDGGRLDTALPPPSEESGRELRERIKRTLQESPVPLTRKQLAGMMHRKGIGGRFAQEVSALLVGGEIHEDDKFLTDDATKFEVGD